MAKSNAKGKTPVRNNGAGNQKGKQADKNTSVNILPSPLPVSHQDRSPLSHPPPPPPTFPPPEVVQAELAAKAAELYRKMDPLKPRPLHERDTISIGAEGLAIGDEGFWASVPQHLHSLVKNYYSSPPVRSRNGMDMKETELHALAQKLVEGGFVDEHGMAPNIGLPFDPSMLEDSDLSQYIKDAAATLVPLPAMDFRVDVRLEGPEIDDDEYYSEDEVDEEPEMQVPLSQEETYPYNTNVDSLEHNPHTATYETSTQRKNLSASTTVPAQATKTANLPMPERSAEPRPTPQSADRRRDKSSLPPSLSSTTTTTGTMPVPKSQQPPPPSSVSMGKKPMLYPPASQTTTTAATTTQQQQSQGKSARAASKQPLPAHAYPHNHPHHHPSSPSSNASQPQKPRPPNPNSNSSKNNKIWSTSNSEERERIKEFWLGLGEEERRNLVKIEKDTVLRKMKEQQKHSCNCAVCGRKRTAIEEELEVLYDAYYDELEQYANYQQRYVSSGRTIPPPPGPGPFPGSVELDKDGAVVGPNSKSSHPPSRNSGKHPNGINGRKPQQPSIKPAESEFDDDEGDEYDEDDEEYEEEEEEGEEEDEEEEDVPEEEDEKPSRGGRQGRGAPPARGRRATANAKANGREGLFSSLTVTGPGNILTVADDLLKNDGQKFLEMMEQLAERRMQREEEAAVDVEDDSEEEDEEEEEDDEEEEDEDDEDDEDDEEIMTEEQKMEEGKRMFSIFAARMFEQRVLQAYREKVAQERQLQLLRELEDEDKLTKEKEAKKQSQNQKKKDKKKQQKMAKEEERAMKAAEKAAEEAALRAKQTALEEEQRKRKEEDRMKRETERKAREEEKQRKDEERRKRLQEEKEREAEREKKRKEKEERAKAERRDREEKERKAREDREAKAAQEKAAAAAAKREQMDKEKKERDEKERKEKEEKAEKEAKDRLAQQQQQQRAAAAASSSKNTRAPPSPRNATASGSSSNQRTPSVNGVVNKKILSKPPPVSAPPAGPSQIQPSTSQRSQQSRATVTHPSQPPTPITPQLSQHMPPQPLMFPSGPPGILPPANALSPRMPFAPPPFGFAPGPSMQPSPTSPLAPSALPRGFGMGGPPPPFDTPFPRGIAPIVAPPTPIGPPPKTPLPSLGPTSLAPGSNRRSSVPDPGPITRPIAPIARPTEASTSNSGSPVRRSPSPKGVLGSSALATDDDEVVSAPTRRSGSVGTVGQGWGPASPRGAIGDNALRPPWVSAAPGAPLMPPPGFGSPRPMGSLWGAPGNPDWHPSNGPFYPNTFLTNAASPPPHSNS